MLLAVLASDCRAAADQAPHPAAQYLPEGVVTVNVLEMVATPRAQELSARLQQAVRENNSWFIEYVRSAQEGGPLPYHPKLGLTEAEYQELLVLSDHLRLAPSRQARLEFKRLSATQFEINGGTDLPDLTGISIDLESDRVTTPLGVAQTRGAVEASPDQEATGPWDGVSWKTTELDEGMQNGHSVRFYVGRLTESGLGILYYDAKRLESGSVRRATQVVTYPLERR